VKAPKKGRGLIFQCCNDKDEDEWEYPEPYNFHLLSIWNYLGKVGLEYGLTGMRNFLNLYWDKAKMSRATEEIRREMAIKMTAVFRSRMFSSTWLGTKILVTLSPMVEKKLWMSNGSPPFFVMRDLFLSGSGIGIIE